MEIIYKWELSSLKIYVNPSQRFSGVSKLSEHVNFPLIRDTPLPSPCGTNVFRAITGFIKNSVRELTGYRVVWNRVVRKRIPPAIASSPPPLQTEKTAKSLEIFLLSRDYVRFYWGHFK